MFRFNGQTTLASQLLHSIDYHLKLIQSPMEQQSTSIEDDDDDEIWLSDHRSIFSSDQNSSQRTSLCQSQYEGFHWDLYENRNYHHLAFEQDDKRINSLSDWSMDFNSDRPRTSWQEIKNKSLSHSRSSSTNTSSPSDHHSSSNPLTLYHLFQRTKSHQHPCRLYQNFSDESVWNSSTSSSSYTDSSKPHPMPRIKLKSPTTFSEIKFNRDQSQQTSLINPLSKSVDRLSNNPSQSSSSSTRQSLPDLDFLTYYAKENPPSLSTTKKSSCTVMKTPLFQPLTGIRTVFFCTIRNPPNRPIIFHSSLPKSRGVKRVTTSPMTNFAEETEPFSSISSSSSSSGYFSNSSRHTQTPSSPYPLKSCLKRTKVDDPDESSKYRRYSAPTTSTKTSDRTSPSNENTYTLSEHDLRAKKSVSFCHEIARRLITPSVHSPREHDDFCDLIPREHFLDSPPNEFNLSDDEHDHDNHVINFIEDQTSRPLLTKYGQDQNLIQTFAKTILRILEIRCNDPKAFYLNNQTNAELDRTLREDFCPLLREILEDGLRQNSTMLFSKKIDLWRLIELTTPTTGRLHEAKMKSQVNLPSTIDWIEKFNSFIYQLLNLHQLTAWLTHFLSQRTILHTHYEFWAFVLVNNNNDLVESISNQLEKLSPLAFRLKYLPMSLTNQQRSILSKKFQVRTWLRDRKSQVKISSIESPSVSPPHLTIRRKFNSIPVTKTKLV